MSLRRAPLVAALLFAATGCAVLVVRSPKSTVHLRADAANGAPASVADPEFGAARKGSNARPDVASEPRDLARQRSLSTVPIPTVPLPVEVTIPDVGGLIGGDTPDAADRACTDALVLRKAEDLDEPAGYDMSRLTGALRMVARSTGPIAYAPDGRRIAYVIGPEMTSSLCVGDVLAKKATAVARGVRILTAANFPLQWAGTGALLYAQEESGAGGTVYSVFRYDAQHHSTSRVVPGVAAMRVSPSGLFLAYTRGGLGEAGDLYVVSSSGGAARHLLTAPSQLLSIRWSPDGLSLAVGAPLRIVDVATGTSRSYDGCSNGSVAAVWSSDGLRLAYSSADLAANCLAIVNRLTGEIDHRSGGGWPQSWSPDGLRMLLSGHSDIGTNGLDAAIEELDMLTGARRRIGHVDRDGDEFHYLFGEYSPDGLTLRISHQLQR